jgi:hypothetical protein
MCQAILGEVFTKLYGSLIKGDVGKLALAPKSIFGKTTGSPIKMATKF